MPALFYHPRMLSYDFGPKHPLKPERLRRTILLSEAVLRSSPWEDPGPGSVTDAEHIHSADYIAMVMRLSDGELVDAVSYGFGSVDNPPFLGMHEASLAYLSGTVAAARAILDGETLAVNIAGGLHHALRDRASGFCIYNDPAIAIAILKEKFGRIAYVDIDLHHGDGVEQIWCDDPTVLTYSIHQDGRTLYPGTGSVRDTGAAYSVLNLPLWPGTTGEVWIEGLTATLMPALKSFQPQAIVLQMGSDPHDLDPLGQLRLTAQEWLQAIPMVQSLEVPILALGGGGYNLTTVPRMWTAAILTLLGEMVPTAIPDTIDPSWGMTRFQDSELPQPRSQNRNRMVDTVEYLRTHVLPNVGSSK